MKPITLVFLVFTVSAVAEPTPSADEVRRAQAMVTETIPHVHFTDIPFDDALTAIRGEWDQRFPNDPFPVALTDYRPPEGYRETNPARITLDLKNVPFIEALRYIGILSGRHLVSVSGLVILESYGWIEEDWSTRLHDVSPAALAALNLKSDSSSDDLRRAFKQFGVKVDDLKKVGLVNSGQQIVVASYQAQQEQVAGILFLLGNGFSITK
ncbi:MAG TPA: hypothetical protein PK529_11810 [Verrucomicrobiales bacterium]|nr:hypothetical protein [Verrucomicrobiales bacterium]